MGDFSPLFVRKICVHVVCHDTWITIYVDLSLDHDSLFLCQDPVGKGIRYDGEPFAFLIPFYGVYPTLDPIGCLGCVVSIGIMMLVQ